ncbi:MAG: hypothetical protein V4712_10560 [Pseudomonadota bacterium]
MRPFLILALLTATPALAYLSPAGLTVTRTSASDFTVNYSANARLSDYWCAAGLYATQALDLPDSTRVYRLSPPPRGAGQGISFTLDAARSAGVTGITTFGGPQDGSMSAGGGASGLCYSVRMPRP